MARHVKKETGAKNMVLAGGVALNCVANGKILKERIFDGLWIQPAAGDAGGALGAALLAHYAYFNNKRTMNPTGRDTQLGSYLGPKYSSREVRAFLDRQGYPYEQITDPQERAGRIAATLAEGKIVGFLGGRMEFGPRSLGGRSILGDPRRADTQSLMNLKIKYRESFRPFAPSVLVGDVDQYFEMKEESPYMLLVAPVNEDRRKPCDRSAFERGDDDMIRVINQPRSDVPAITHVDYSARVQTVHADDSPEFHRVLAAFKQQTGCAVLVNTSFNVRGEPIVCSPKDAYTCFMRTEMDLLVLEDCLVWKADQPKFEDSQDWRREHELD
jgi:carbamoyltransferase